MRLQKPWLLIAILLTVLASVWGTDVRAQGPDSKLCSLESFSSQRAQWAKKNYEFHLLKGGSFAQSGSTYVLAVAFEESRNSDNVQFLVFRSPVGQANFAAVFNDEIEVASFGDFSNSADGCIMSGAGIYFHVSVVDLAGNGTQQIIVESNSIGVCSSCRSFVHVYQVQDTKISQVVEETYSNIKFGRGQGLWIQSLRADSKGQYVAYEKSFFTKNGSNKRPSN